MRLIWSPTDHCGSRFANFYPRQAPRGFPALAVEGIHTFVRLLVDRWKAGDPKPLVVQSADILSMMRDSGWPRSDQEELSYAISELWRRELERNPSFEQDLNFLRIWKRLFSPSMPEQDVKYYFMRSIRRRYRLKPSAATARQFHAIARAIAPLAERSAGSSVPYDEFWQSIPAFAEDAPSFPVESIPAADAYCDLCWALDLVKPTGPGLVAVEPEVADAEHLMSHLFGVPTCIPGFDELFGGGLALADSVGRLPATKSGTRPSRLRCTATAASSNAASLGRRRYTA